MKFNKFLSFIVGICVAIMTSLYLYWLCSNIIHRASVKRAIIFTLAVIVVVTLPYIFRKKLKILLKKAYTPLKFIFGAAVISYVVLFSLFSAYVMKSDFSYDVFVRNHDDYDAKYVFITLGCKTDGLEPGIALTHRLDLTEKLMKKYPGSVGIMSGGQGANETVSEAFSMKNYLVEHDISENRIYMEDKSDNTIQNIEFSKNVYLENELDNYNIVVVSSYYHILRVSMICDNNSLNAEYVSVMNFDLSSMVHEFMAIVHYVVLGS